MTKEDALREIARIASETATRPARRLDRIIKILARIGVWQGAQEDGQ